MVRGPEREATGQEKIRVLEARGEPLEKFWSQGSGRPHLPTHASRHRGGGREEIVGRNGTATGPENLQIWKIGGNHWRNFGRQGPGMEDTGLHHPHYPTRLGVLPPHHLSHTAPSLAPPHPLAHPASSQGTGSHKGRGDSRIDLHRSHSLRLPQASQP